MNNSKRTFLGILVLMNIALHAQEWRGYADSARIFQQQKDNGRAITYFLQASEALEKDSAETVTNFRLNSEIGDIYAAMGQYPKAEPFYNNAKLVIEKIKGKENTDYALICNNLGRLFRLMSQYTKAEPLLTEARSLRGKLLGKESADYATSCNNLAVLYAELGQYDNAGPLYMEAMQIRRKVLGKEHIDYATSCNNLAIYYILTGRSSVAEPLYIEAKNIREKVLGKEHPFYAASCDNLAILYMDLGNYETAETLYKEARGIREKALGPKHIEYAKGCNNLALLYKLLGQYGKAAALFAEAKEIFAEAVGKEHFEYGKCCNNLGAVYMDMNDYAKAAPLYQEAREVWAKAVGKDDPEYAKSCHNLALVEFEKDNYEAAIALFNEANTIREKAFGKEHLDYAEGCDNLATVYVKQGDCKKAIALYIQARQVREKIVGTAHPDYVQTCINLANAYRNCGDRAMALNLYTEAFSSQQVLLKKVFRFTTEPEKQAYLKKINEYRSYFLSFSAEMPNEKSAVYAWEASLANKNLVLNESQRLRMIASNNPDTALLNKYNNWISMREQLAFWYTRPTAGDRKTELAELEEKANQLEKVLVHSSAPFQKEHGEKSWRDIQQSLKAGEAALEFSSFQYHDGRKWGDSTYYIAIVIRKDKPAPELVSLFEKKELAVLLGKISPGPQLLNSLYTYPNKTAGKKTGSPLYNLVWKPMESALAGIHTVYFSPAGELYKVAFAALPLNNMQVLADKYKLVQLNSTAAIGETAGSILGPNDKLVLYGGIQYEADSASIRRAVLTAAANNLAKRSVPEELLRSSGGDFNFLAESEKEVNAISRMAIQKNYEAIIAKGLGATEESVKALSGAGSPAVLHIATHGFFFSDPSASGKELRSTGRSPFENSGNPLIRSGLALAGANNAWKRKPVTGVEDGILTAYEVSNMYLPHTRLAVLSACETGLGDIQGSEGVYGLQRAFKMAGAANLVMSLWKVPDAESAEFMQEFYNNLFAKQSIHEAFYNAQTIMKNKYRNAPYKWAAWVLVN